MNQVFAEKVARLFRKATKKRHVQSSASSHKSVIDSANGLGIHK
jgi:hypothetical protein